MSDFCHCLSLDRIRDGDRIDMVADDKERAELADRLGLLSLDRLEAHAILARDGPAVRATGRLKASLDQVNEATENPFEGGTNDVPITHMCEQVELDLREVLGEIGLPQAVRTPSGIAM